MAIDRRELLVLLLHVRGSKGMENEPIVGVTRLQKLLYLLKREYEIDKVSSNYFSFEPYKFGPYASQLYDDIAFLENLGFIESGGKQLSSSPSRGENLPLPPLVGFGEHSASRADIEEARAGYDYLIGAERDELHEEDLQEKVFRLTSRGEEAVHSILEQITPRQRNTLISKLEEVKKRFAGLTLRQLLGYVYREYPESATESEIIDRV
jgi:hypothetical protein